MPWFERLTTLDSTFLHLEGRAAHMHVGALAIFEGTPPPIADVLALVGARLDRIPRYRQRLAWPPLGRPVWVDDDTFDLEYHVRQTALPAPGDDALLKKLAGRLLSQQLDRDKPLWELWLVEGLSHGRFAILSKTHHCMVDGVSGVDIATVLLDVDADPTPPAPPNKEWIPRPPPTHLDLLGEAMKQQVTEPLQAMRAAFEPESETRKLFDELRAGAPAILGLAQLGSAPRSSLNGRIGPHRRFETVRLELSDVKRVRATLGGTVNDVILTVMSIALRARLTDRGDAVAEPLRVMVPVSVRSAEQRGTFGNQVTAMFCPLPVDEHDPVRALHRVSEAMKGLKESGQAVGARTLSRLGDFAPPTIAAQAARLQAVTRFFNLAITNVPGPQFPLYMLGRKLAGCFPAVPLAEGLTLGVALLSYDGGIGIGLLGDHDKAKDLSALADEIRAALAALLRAGAAAAHAQVN
ncbi:MAG: wax ester/triacylglycerol synthase family O-acyltransferase [Polyangiales bacterium]